MNRRSFLWLATSLTAVGFISTKEGRAQPQMAGGLYYTHDFSGRWKGKEAGHVPKIEILKNKGKAQIQVMTAHEMKGCEHYIVKHIVLDKNYRFLDEHLFNPEKDQVPVSRFALGNYTGQVYVLSVCNKHDTWLNHTLI